MSGGASCLIMAMAWQSKPKDGGLQRGGLENENENEDEDKEENGAIR